MSEKPKHRGRRVEAEIRTSAAPERVWEAWADPEKLAGWFPDKAAGHAKPGGTMKWIWEQFGMEETCEVVEAEPGAKLTMLTPWGKPVPLLLEVTISVEGGETVLRLVHSGFGEDAVWDEEYEGVRCGWRVELAILREYVERHFGRPRSRFFVMRPARFDFEALRPYFRDAKHLSRWLTSEGSIGAAGSRYALSLKNGERMSGRIIEDTGRDVALTWEEIEGIMVLKSFSWGTDRMVNVIGFGWGLDAGRAAAIERDMSAAVDRLLDALPAASAAG